MNHHDDATTDELLAKAAHIGGDRRWKWPRGAGEHAVLRALVRHGLARETTGECEGCESHEPGHTVAVFELLNIDD